MIQDTLRGPLPDSTGLYDGSKLVALLDRIPSMNTGERTSLDVVLTWITSLCLLHKRMGIAA